MSTVASPYYSRPYSTVNGEPITICAFCLGHIHLNIAACPAVAKITYFKDGSIKSVTKR